MLPVFGRMKGRRNMSLVQSCVGKMLAWHHMGRAFKRLSHFKLQDCPNRAETISFLNSS